MYDTAACVAAPDGIFGQDIGSNYQAQGLNLPKYLRPEMWDIAALAEADAPAVMPQIEAIFFDSAATQVSPPKRNALPIATYGSAGMCGTVRSNSSSRAIRVTTSSAIWPALFSATRSRCPGQTTMTAFRPP